MTYMTYMTYPEQKLSQFSTFNFQFLRRLKIEYRTYDGINCDSVPYI